MKKERWKTWPTTAAMPRATTIETTAIISGTKAATTAPKTSSSTISAAGRPYCSSPRARSRCEHLDEVVARRSSDPVMSTETPSRRSAACDRVDDVGDADQGIGVRRRRPRRCRPSRPGTRTAFPSCETSPTASAAYGSPTPRTASAFTICLAQAVDVSRTRGSFTSAAVGHDDDDSLTWSRSGSGRRPGPAPDGVGLVGDAALGESARTPGAARSPRSPGPRRRTRRPRCATGAGRTPSPFAV